MDRMVFFHKIFRKVRHYSLKFTRQFKFVDRTAHLPRSVKVYDYDNIVMEEHTGISSGSVIMNTRAKFVMKKYSGAAFGLNVVTGAHMSVVGMNYREVSDEVKDKLDVHHKFDRDVIVNEDVWIASNVTLLSGVIIGRGAVIGSGAIVRSSIPPYSIVVGNPAKVIGFRFTPEEILEHESKLYAKEERLSLEILEKNYEKYFLSRFKEIREFTKI